MQLDKSELALDQGKEVTQFQLTVGYTPARHDGVAPRSAQPLGEVAMALLPQNPRNQKLLVLALAVGRPRGRLPADCVDAEERRAERARSAPRHARLAEQRREGRSREGQRGEDEAGSRAYARELAVLRRLVPTENEVPALLESISSAARRAGLELSDVQPDGVINGDQFDTYRYKLGVTGPYHQVAEFLVEHRIAAAHRRADQPDAHSDDARR